MSRTTPAPTTDPQTAPAPQPAEDNEEPLTLTGRLVADPILRHTQNGTPVTNFRIAVNYDDGRPATFHNVVSWKRTADAVAKYMRKGRLVEVSGREQTRTWTDAEGIERTSVEINAFTVQFLSKSPQAAKPAEVAAA